MSVPPLRTRRLLLDPLEPERDAADLLALYADSRFGARLASGAHDGVESKLAYLRVFEDLPEGQGGWVARAVGDPTGRVIGRFSLRPWRHAGPGDPLEVGWFLVVDQWGRGLAAEGMRAVLRYAWLECGQDRVIALVRHDNERSRSLALRLGGVVTSEGTWYGPEPALRYELALPRLRAARIEDAVAMHRVWCRANDTRNPARAPIPTTVEQVRARIRDAISAVVVEQAGHVVGSGVLGEVTRGPSSADGFVALVATTPERQGWGIADAVMGELLATADAANRSLELFVAEGNDRAAALYRRHGFRATGELRLSPSGEVSAVMVRSL